MLRFQEVLEKCESDSEQLTETDVCVGDEYQERCKICELAFPTPALFQKHQAEHSLKDNSKKAYPCRMCSSSFTTKRRLEDHMLRHEGNYVTCKICNKSVVKSLLISHQKAHAQKQEWRCENCDKLFSTKAGLKKHETRTHKIREFKFSCEICKKGFITKYYLQEHVRVVHEGTRYSCESCLKQFTSKGALKVHQRLHNEAPDRTYRTCPECRKEISLTIYRRHRYMHRKEKTSTTKVCDICGSKLKSPEGFQIHMRNHLNDKPFVCQYCGKAFVTKSILSNHVVVHTGEKKHVCSICGEKFLHSTLLRNHRKSKHK